MEQENPYKKMREDALEAVKNSSEFQNAVRDLAGGWVYLNLTGQVVMVNDIIPSVDGVLIRTHGAGVVPLADLRKATQEEIDARLK